MPTDFLGRPHRAVVGLLASFVLLPAGTGCSAPDPGPAVTLNVNIVAESSAVRVTYEVVNHADDDVIVLNRPNARGEDPDPNQVFITAGPEPGAVLIVKQAFPRPAGLLNAVEPLIGGTVLGRGQSIREDVVQRRPLRGGTPFEAVALPDPITSLTFCVGVVRVREAPRPSGSGGRFATFGNEQEIVAVQHVFCSEPVKVRIPQS